MIIILAGGYAKRLLPLTRNIPKPLLPINGKPVIDYLVDRLLPMATDNDDRVMILTNSKFEQHFIKWGKRWSSLGLEIISDGSTCEADKLGAVGALARIAPGITDDFMIVASDCIYADDFSGLIEYYKVKNAPVIGIYQARNENQGIRGSTVTMDNDGRIIGFVEKPQKLVSQYVGAVIYSLPKRIKERLTEYVTLGLTNDEPGRFIEWLHTVEAVYGYQMPNGVWDIGTLSDYESANQYYGTNKTLDRSN